MRVCLAVCHVAVIGGMSMEVPCRAFLDPEEEEEEEGEGER
jgi:hypothetical protein